MDKALLGRIRRTNTLVDRWWQIERQISIVDTESDRCHQKKTRPCPSHRLVQVRKTIRQGFRRALLFDRNGWTKVPIRIELRRLNPGFDFRSHAVHFVDNGTHQRAGA